MSFQDIEIVSYDQLKNLYQEDDPIQFVNQVLPYFNKLNTNYQTIVNFVQNNYDTLGTSFYQIPNPYGNTGYGGGKTYKKSKHSKLKSKKSKKSKKLKFKN
jgi:hypothetical protein